MNTFVKLILSATCLIAHSATICAQMPPSRPMILRQLDEVKREEQKIRDEQGMVRDIALSGTGIIIGTLATVEVNEWLNRRFSQWYPPFLLPTVRWGGAATAITAALLTPYRVIALRLQLHRAQVRLVQEQSDLENLLGKMRVTN